MTRLREAAHEHPCTKLSYFNFIPHLLCMSCDVSSKLPHAPVPLLFALIYT
jgi:hypothetical protein